MKICDLVSIRSFPSVVQAADVRALRERPQSSATRDFVGGYLGFDDRARHATETLLGSLSSANGGAFFLNGVFGSGKSHLLGCVALLCDGAGHDAFADSHPHLNNALKTFAPRFVVHFSLDDYAAERFSLEEIFWREVRNEWTRRGFSPDELALPTNAARGETFAAWEETLTRRELRGMVVCIDELSLFLSGREHRALQGDAAFLQFMAQRARRSQTSSNAESSTRCGLWIVAALQKTVEEIGDLDAYALSQIRDRFVTLPLSLAHLPSLVERRLVVASDAEKLARFCDEAYDEIVRALPHLDFGRDEWKRLYPFHPATISLLAAIAVRFGSRTRSAVVFCQSIDTENPARHRVLVTDLFDFWESELSTFPDLKPLVEVWRAWPEIEGNIAIDEAEAQTMRALMKGVLLFTIGGRSASLAALTNALLLDARLPNDGNYEYVQVLLEKMRLGGAGLSLERRDGVFADRYGIDGEARAGELARRFTFNVLHNLPIGDRRIAHYLLGCCREEMPLASLESSRNHDVMWLHAPRVVAVELASEVPPIETLANRLAALTQANAAHDFLLFIVPPLTVLGDVSSTRYASHEDAERWADAWRERVDATLEILQHDEEFDIHRWQNALVWWIPRGATKGEWEQAREATAQSQLLHDPQLADNARGRGVLEHLRSGLNERETALARLGARLLREGSLSNGGGAFIEAGELPLGESWTSALEAIAEWTLPNVFPRFAEVAPRLRVLTPSNADALCLETLRRPTEAPFFAASLERTVRGIAQPLGAAVEQGGRWKIVASSTRNAAANELLMVLRQSQNTTLGAIEAHLAKSAWGLNPLQTRVLLCALLRGGEIAAFDARGQLLAPNEIGLPLSRSIQTLREGRLLDEESWARLTQIVELLSGEVVGELSFANQEQARSLLQTAQSEIVAATELAQARLHQWHRKLSSSESLTRAAETLTEMGQIATGLQLASGVESLARVAQLSSPELSPVVQSWREIIEQLEKRHAILWETHSFLTHPELIAPPEMNENRQELVTRFEQFLDDEALTEDAIRWRNEYSKRYEEWHAAQNNPARFATYRRLGESDEWRALNLLSSLATRTFPFANELQSALQNEIVKGCRRDGRLSNEPVCAACRLRWGQRLQLRDPREIEAIAQNGLDVFRQSLREDKVRQFLSEREDGAALLEWNENGDVTTLLSLLTPATLQLLDDAFRPRRRVLRLWPELESSTRKCRTKREWRAVLLHWLEGDDHLNDDDEIALVKAEPNESEALATGLSNNHIRL